MNSVEDTSPLCLAQSRFLSLKRSLGHRYRHEAWVLRMLWRHVEECGRLDLDADCFKSWLTRLKDHHPNTRRKWYQIVRHFCVYRRRDEPDCFLPSIEGAPKRQPYVIPVIVEPAQIACMLRIASERPVNPRTPLRSQALRLAIVLLYTCGLRISEVSRLTMGDIEEQCTVLRIRESKFHKSRLVPLSASATSELQEYLRQRRKAFTVRPTAPLLCNGYFGHVRPYSIPGLQSAITLLFISAGIRDERGRLPRVHDLRHSFAIQALIRQGKRTKIA